MAIEQMDADEARDSLKKIARQNARINGKLRDIADAQEDVKGHKAELVQMRADLSKLIQDATTALPLLSGQADDEEDDSAFKIA